MKRTLLGGMDLGLLSGLYAWQIEPFWLEFVHKTMPISNLPKHLVGETLMQISDVHVGNRFDYSNIIDAFKKAQKLNPDLVVYTGDDVSYEDETQLSQLDEVLQYVVQGKLATVGVLVNHDYSEVWAEQDVADQITNQFEDAGIQILRNHQQDFDGLNIIGFDDYWALTRNIHSKSI